MVRGKPEPSFGGFGVSRLCTLCLEEYCESSITAVF